MQSELKFVVANPSNLSAMLSWFSSEQDIAQWGGPGVRYPFDLSSLIADIKLSSLDSFCLLDHNVELLAFGQCYERLGHCHLGRLAVAPSHRGKGLVNELIAGLIEFGTKKFAVAPSSLFVLSNNIGAISAYKKYGFIEAEYPEPMPLKDCLYMTYEKG